MSAEFRKCIKRERDRARSRRESAQGQFEASHQSLDRLVDSFEDPSKAAAFSDGGAGAEALRSFETGRYGSYYTRRIKVARMRLSRKFPELVEVFNLVVKNGKNRHESIAELVARGRSPDAARTLYWKHLKKISFFFRAQ